MIVNGVALPDIPAEVLEQYPYIFITHGESTLGTEAYTIIASATEFLHMSPDIFPDIEEGLYCLSDSKMIDYDSDEAAWNEDGSVLPAMTNLLVFQNAGIGTMTIVYSNYDIYTVASINADTEEFTKGEIYFSNSEAEEEPEETKPPRYSIATAILDAVARQIMRLTDSTEKVKPEEFEPKLEGINIQLQELTVTATEEVQTITPPSGVYGFSKVIVEAVESSGGTGGGGPGEGGDDSGGSTEKPIDYPIAEETIFGAINAGSDIYTGNYTYGSLTTKLPASSLPYKIILKYSSVSYITFLALSVKPYVSNYHLNFSGATQDRWDKNNGSDDWEQISIGATNASGSQAFSRIIWANFDVPKNSSDGTEYFTKAQEPVPETVDGVSVEVYEYEDTYIIDGSTLTDIALATQQITGGNATNAAEIAAALVAYASASVKPE